MQGKKYVEIKFDEEEKEMLIQTRDNLKKIQDVLLVNKINEKMQDNITGTRSMISDILNKNWLDCK